MGGGFFVVSGFLARGGVSLFFRIDTEVGAKGGKHKQ
jgi:hypothetical protein